MNAILGSIGGRKFLMAIAGAIAVALASKFGVDEDTTLKIAGIIISFIIAQGVADAASGGSTSTTVK